MEFQKTAAKNKSLLLLAVLVAKNARDERRDDRRVIEQDRKRTDLPGRRQFIDVPFENCAVRSNELKIQSFCHFEAPETTNSSG